ncbi:hypothetical protein [uncultured Draconibacterium sp.]|uniref:hypothetical protein n=1 Tax=uncultured Draconibacterium sp. TaxID=1573823 RepID=UPI002AA740F0|nr:hypothetical protein [uncultured Draconibacterium sp.]
METFEEKLKKSFVKSLKKDGLDERLLNYLLDKIINDVISFERQEILDLEQQAKTITNSFIEKAKELKI